MCKPHPERKGWVRLASGWWEFAGYCGVIKRRHRWQAYIRRGDTAQAIGWFPKCRLAKQAALQRSKQPSSLERLQEIRALSLFLGFSNWSYD